MMKEASSFFSVDFINIMIISFRIFNRSGFFLLYLGGVLLSIDILNSFDRTLVFLFIILLLRTHHHHFIIFIIIIIIVCVGRRDCIGVTGVIFFFKFIHFIIFYESTLYSGFFVGNLRSTGEGSRDGVGELPSEEFIFIFFNFFSPFFERIGSYLSYALLFLVEFIIIISHKGVSHHFLKLAILHSIIFYKLNIFSINFLFFCVFFVDFSNKN